MPGERENRQNTTGCHGLRGRWWNTLAFRLGVVANVTMVAVLALSAWVDHRRDPEGRIQHAWTRLHEEARVLSAAWSQFRDRRQFPTFVDGFCRQMTASASQGHHIALFDATGDVRVRMHERAGTKLERRVNASAAGGAAIHP